MDQCKPKIEIFQAMDFKLLQNMGVDWVKNTATLNLCDSVTKSPMRPGAPSSA